MGGRLPTAPTCRLSLYHLLQKTVLFYLPKSQRPCPAELGSMGEGRARTFGEHLPQRIYSGAKTEVATELTGSMELAPHLLCT